MEDQKTNQQKNLYTIAGAIVIAGLIVAGAIIYNNKTPSNSLPTNLPQTENSNQKEEVKVKLNVGENDHILGDPEAKVTIVEFSDFQCPFCKRFHPTLKQALKEYEGKVRWIYKHFPLRSIHPQAQSAAEASECAGEQGKFWEFADKLFENQERLGEDLYTELAQDLGLDLTNFNQCLSSRKYKDDVESDYQEGIKAGVRGTPGSFVNGKPVFGAVPYSVLKAEIENALSEVSQ